MLTIIIIIIIIIIRITFNTKYTCILRSALFWVIMLRNNPEERNTYLLGGGSLQSRISVPKRWLQNCSFIPQHPKRTTNPHSTQSKLRTRDIRKSAAGSAVRAASLCLMTCSIVV
jgi:hypothetical protein